MTSANRSNAQRLVSQVVPGLTPTSISELEIPDFAKIRSTVRRSSIVCQNSRFRSGLSIPINSSTRKYRSTS